jgi:hypothetical protein
MFGYIVLQIMPKNVLLATLIIGLLFVVNAKSQDAVKPSVVMGDVLSIDAAKIVLKTKDGDITATLTDKTEFKRVPPENPRLAAAVASTSSDIGVGDKVVITGVFGADKSTLPARAVYLMTKSDIAQRHAKEAEEWRTRGITGRVASVNAQTGQIVVEQRGLMGTTTLTLTPKNSAQFLRYAPNSIKFEEALPSSVADIKQGDMLRALGDRGADGTTFSAERIITGAFQTVAGTVKSIDAATGEVVITNLQTKKDMTVAVTPASVLKRFPEEMATRMAAFQGGGVRPPGQAPANPAGGQAGQAPQRPMGGMGARAGGIDEMLDRFPNIKPADLKVGDMIAVSSTRTANLDRITAIKLLAGVEPFIRMAQAAGGMQGGQRGGGQGDFNIPGLDGFGGP